jgi:hypothetical protein
VSPDRELLVDVEHVLHGPDGAGVVRRVLYAVYVGAILSFTYGFTVARAVLLSSDPGWVRGTLLSLPAAGVALLVAALLLVLAHGVGRRRGPVVPPLPWVDHVVSSAIDRAVAVREWWVVSSTLVVATAGVIGAVLGGSLWAARAAGPVALVTGALTGLVLGGALSLVWLAGQVGPRHGAERWVRPAGALRRLTLDGLRTHAVRTTHVGGAVLSGDLRAARLEVSTPVRRARHVRLRSHGPFLTVAARDLLGLRRQPGLLVLGLVLVVPGAAGTAWALAEPQVPTVLAIGSVAAAYLGAGIWSEGARLLGDTLGTPRLSGLDARTEAAAHSVVPGALLLVVTLGVGVVTHAAVPTSPTPAAGAVGWLALVTALVIATTWVSAYRGRPPRPAFSPTSGPFQLVSWYGRPLLAVSLAGGFLTAAAAEVGVTAAPGTGLLVATAWMWWWAVHSLDRAVRAHRD